MWQAAARHQGGEMSSSLDVVPPRPPPCSSHTWEVHTCTPPPPTAPLFVLNHLVLQVAGRPGGGSPQGTGWAAMTRRSRPVRCGAL
ncbi:hypothetical protein E2C01_055251 [Portunus trituberculatus]|uniref:Uncharacterized protein n=1 Tax=Portunus trituberculatus TaxID=210409 RepID=A0A5B7GUB4_PORTR|nr:hypothetical protein [Portunus trituberculatus]